MRVLVPWILSPDHSVSGRGGGGGGMVTDPEACAGWMVVTSWCQWAPPPSLLHPSHILVIVSRSCSFAPYPPSPLPLSLPPPPPPPLLPSLLPLFQGGRGREKGGGGGRGAARWGRVSFIRKALFVSLHSLPFCTFSYLQLPSLGRAHVRHRRRAAAAAAAANTWPKSFWTWSCPNSGRGGGGGRMVRRKCSVCADDDDENVAHKRTEQKRKR